MLAWCQASLRRDAPCGTTVADLRAAPEIRSQRSRAWATDDGVRVTVTKLEGTAIAGTFSGAFEYPGEHTNPGDGPATVSNGKFAVTLLQ